MTSNLPEKLHRPRAAQALSSVMPAEFQPAGVYLDSARYGLPPKAALQPLSAVTGACANGSYDPGSGVLRTPHGGHAEIRHLWVDPEARDMCLGRQLVRELERLARARLQSDQTRHASCTDRGHRPLSQPRLSAGRGL